MKKEITADQIVLALWVIAAVIVGFAYSTRNLVNDINEYTALRFSEKVGLFIMLFVLSAALTYFGFVFKRGFKGFNYYKSNFQLDIKTLLKGVASAFIIPIGFYFIISGTLGFLDAVAFIPPIIDKLKLFLIWLFYAFIGSYFIIAGFEVLKKKEVKHEKYDAPPPVPDK